LFDFHEGWLYVIGVGVAGGMLTSGANVGNSESAQPNSLAPRTGLGNQGA
jgi:hypothetical protein